MTKSHKEHPKKDPDQNPVKVHISIKWNKLKAIILPIALAIILVGLSITTYIIYAEDYFVPGVFVGDTNLSLMTKSQARQIIRDKINQRLQSTLQFQQKDKTLTLNITTLNPQVDYSVIDQAFTLGHSSNPIFKVYDQVQLLLSPKILAPTVTFNSDEQLQTIAKAVEQPAVDASIWLDEQNQIHIKEGVDGSSLDQEKLINQLKNHIVFGNTNSELPMKKLSPNLTNEQARLSKQALESVQTEPIVLMYEEHSLKIDVPTMFYLLNFKTNVVKQDSSLFDKQKLDLFLEEIALEINRPVQEPLFNFDQNTKKVTAFKPAQTGQEVDIDQTINLISKVLNQEISKTITVPVKTVEPKIKSETQADNLGIKELVGKGVSHFPGSIPNRIFNVNLTAQRLNGVLVPPGEVFSFNKTIGEITAATGYKPAYIIKEGRTILDDGGGVCQVSTTLFRAVLNSGLPITERYPHAYRVKYYEIGPTPEGEASFAPGLDATIFSPTVDFKFKNDTANYILIQAHVQGTSLYVDLYGTSDGRTVEMTKPVITDQTPPPPDLRQDDPTLPKGEVKQVDWSAWGAKVSFKRTVKRGEEILSDEIWRSNYKAWQAVFLVGTKEN